MFAWQERHSLTWEHKRRCASLGLWGNETSQAITCHQVEGEVLVAKRTLAAKKRQTPCVNV